MIMNATVSVQDLWSQILALPAGDRHWLQDKLKVYESEEEEHLTPKVYESEEEEHLTPYTMEELNARIDQALADVKAGRTISSEEAHRQMKEYIASL